MPGTQENGSRKVTIHRSAFRDYTILDRIEAGIQLRGTEIKVIRSGSVSLTGSFADEENGELFLHGMHVPTYEHGGIFNHDPLRTRRLLLHKKEILRLKAATEQKGYTLIPLSLYFHKGMLKVELAVCKGKTHSDKRETIRRKTADREAQRAIHRR